MQKSSGRESSYINKRNIIMTIKIGDLMPEGEFKLMGEGGPEGLTTKDLFSNKRVVLFSVPGAFTPTCSAQHLPGYIETSDALKEKGVDADKVDEIIEKLKRAGDIFEPRRGFIQKI